MGTLAQRHVGPEKADPDEQQLGQVDRPDQRLAEPAHHPGDEDQEDDDRQQSDGEQRFGLQEHGTHRRPPARSGRLGTPLRTPSIRQELVDLRAKRSEEHTSELQSLMRTSYAVFCLKKKNTYPNT